MKMKDEYGKEAIRQILMERDGMSIDDAQSMIDEFQERVNEITSGGDEDCEITPWELEDEFTSEFGLEPDYFVCFIGL